jgi:hypothetical protein
MFLHLFALGTAGALLAVPFKEIGKYYFKFHATILLVLVCASVLIGRPWIAIADGVAYARVTAAIGLLFALLVLVQNGVVRAAGRDLRIDSLILPVSAGAMFVFLSAFGGTAYGTGKAVLLTAHLLTSAAALGSALVAMTTGHWYLANAKLSFDILVRLCRLFALSIGAKAAVVGIYAVTRFTDYLAMDDFYKLVMGMRIGAGIVLALVLALMSLSCAKRRANQSATGILYVAVVFVLIGETISIYLTLGIQRPI